jgi:hypothetical protein
MARQALGELNLVNQTLDLREGCSIDVLDTEQLWSEAEVIERRLTFVDGRGTKAVLVHYTYWLRKWDEWIPVDSPRLSAPGTRCFLGHNRLRKGQRIECKDTFGKWIEARVIDENERAIQVHYHNWDPKFDEWVERGNTERFSAFGRNTKSHMHKNRSQRRCRALPAAEAGKWQQPQPQQSQQPARRLASSDPRFERYVAALRRARLTVQPMEGDGNCLFRSVSDQVYGTPDHHALVRSSCMDYIESEARYFMPYIEGGEEGFRRYIAAKRLDGTWGDDPEIQACCELYNRSAEIWAFDGEAGAQRLRTFHEVPSGGGRALLPMRLSFYGGGHYDSIRCLEDDDDDDAPRRARQTPGQREQAMIRFSRSQHRAARAGVGAVGTSSTEAHGAGGTAEERELAEALRVSRVAFDSQFDSLDGDFAALVHANLDSVSCAGAGLGAGSAEPVPFSHAAVSQQQLLASARTQAEQTEQAELARAMNASREVFLPQQMAAMSAEQQQLELAMQASLGGWGAAASIAARAPGGGAAGELDPELQAALTASALGSQEQGDLMEEDLQRALLQSLQ